MKKLSILLLFVVASLACSVSTPPAVDTPAQPVETKPQNVPLTFTPIATLTPAAPTSPPPTPSLNEGVTLTSFTFDDFVAEPPFTSKVTLPALQLQSGNDPRIQAFNERLYWLAQDQATFFKNDVIANATVPPIAAGSSIEVQYTLIGQRGSIWSFKYDIYFYFDGAAHPGSYSLAINYDLGNGRELTLADLFQPGSNYLQVIADYCKAELLSRDSVFESFISGADPTTENYARWNLSNEGLVITFDEYQVAPYAAGRQLVTIPYSAMESIANPNGILDAFRQ